jgi:hypothetical protein
VRRLGAGCEYREVDPAEVIGKSIRPNDRRNARCGKIERENRIGNLLRVWQGIRRYIRRRKVEPVANYVLIAPPSLAQKGHCQKEAPGRSGPRGDIAPPNYRRSFQQPQR